MSGTVRTSNSGKIVGKAFDTGSKGTCGRKIFQGKEPMGTVRGSFWGKANIAEFERGWNEKMLYYPRLAAEAKGSITPTAWLGPLRKIRVGVTPSWECSSGGLHDRHVGQTK